MITGLWFGEIKWLRFLQEITEAYGLTLEEGGEYVPGCEGEEGQAGLLSRIGPATGRFKGEREEAEQAFRAYIEANYEGAAGLFLKGKYLMRD